MNSRFDLGGWYYMAPNEEGDPPEGGREIWDGAEVREAK